MQGHTPSPGVVQHLGIARSIAMGGRTSERDLSQWGGGAALHAYVLAAACGPGFGVPNACSKPSCWCALTSALTSYRGSYRALTRCSN